MQPGRRVLLNGRTQFFYSGWSDGSTVKIGIYDITNFSTTFSKDNDNVGSRIIGTVK